MKIVSVINYKGGVGKTTLTACLASFWMNRHKRVLLVDLDAQCNLTCSVLDDQRWKYLYGYPNPGEVGSDIKTLREWYRGMCGDGPVENLGNLILRQQYYAIIPSHLDLLDVDMDLAVYMSQPDSDKPPFRFVNVLGGLRDQLRLIQSKSKFDLVLLDCPPNFNIVTQTAIIASDAILVPVRPNPVSVMGIDHLIRRKGSLVEKFNNSARKVREAGNSDPSDKEDVKILGAVFTMRKVRDGDQAIGQNAAIESELEGNLSKREIPVIGRIRHNEKLFSESSPIDAWRSPLTGDPYDSVKDDIQKTCREIGEALGFQDPYHIEI